MSRRSLRLIAAIVTFTVGVSAAAAWFIAHRPAIGSVGLVDGVPVPSPRGTARIYKKTDAGEVPARVGADDMRAGSFTSFRSSDGMSFTRWTREYESPKQASQAFQRVLTKASEVVSRGPVMDESGHLVEKVVATFPPGYEGAGPASLLWTEGARLIHMDSSSVENILEYKKDFKR